MRIKLFGRLVQAFFIPSSLASLVMSTPALAGSPTGSVTFGPVGAVSVPALGSAALVLLALLLGFIGWVSMRKNGVSAASSITLALAVASASSAGGLQWLQTAQAGAAGTSITQSTGQTLSINPTIVNTYINNAGEPMQPTSITYGSCNPTPVPGECAIGTALAPDDSCQIDCSAIGISDIRLKEAIVRVGTAPNGLPLYEYNYRGDSGVYRGVMAQDVLLHTPKAVLVQSNGYFAVDYRMLGLELVHVR